MDVLLTALFYEYSVEEGKGIFAVFKDPFRGCMTDPFTHLESHWSRFVRIYKLNLNREMCGDLNEKLFGGRLVVKL